MYIKCWGSRGSISVSGREYAEFGGDTTCLEVIAKTGEVIIIDAGTGIRRLGKSLVRRKASEYFMLLTHTHWDHILGISFFAPLLYKENRLVIQDRKFDGLSTRQVFENVMRPPFFPIKLTDFDADLYFDPSLNQKFTIGSIEVEAIPTSHSEDSMGYKFTEEGKSFVFLTDNELGYDHPQSQGAEAYVNFARGADILFHDAEYTQEEYKDKIGWGHSSVSDVLDLAVKAGVGQLGLIHLNQDRTDAQMKEMVRQSCRILENRARKTGAPPISCFGVPSDLELSL
ncbi:MBL fold metallo-hydrolase [Desulfospira joergensenii]|uniref:MBL fold metallo-hydrolase n=1 Tax=Desulfospira joergensenii TaxID=53329 RepID=UPI0003B70509|nr:MBL fold metallo-hydrolase [Desulfospira joergensenii]